MNLSDILGALEEARGTMQAAESAANRVVDLITPDGRLRQVSHYRLVALKRQLARYNTRSKKWR